MAPRMPPMPPVGRAPDPVSDYARRPAPGPQAPQGLDMHGRPAAQPGPQHDDDQLDIPAFLRRQAN
ncbi:hypothetical protein CCR97_24660, partial [Rhodoplanes elegans]